MPLVITWPRALVVVRSLLLFSSVKVTVWMHLYRWLEATPLPLAKVVWHVPIVPLVALWHRVVLLVPFSVRVTLVRSYLEQVRHVAFMSPCGPTTVRTGATFGLYYLLQLRLPSIAHPVHILARRLLAARRVWLSRNVHYPRTTLQPLVRTPWLLACPQRVQGIRTVVLF